MSTPSLTPPSLFCGNLKWKCTACNTINEPSEEICPQCLNPKNGENGAAMKLNELEMEWRCELCRVKNEGSLLQCSACETPRYPQLPLQSPILIKAPPTPGQWKCEDCFIINEPNLDKCAACEKFRHGSSPQPSTSQTRNLFSTGSATFPSTIGTGNYDTALLFGAEAPSKLTPKIYGLPDTPDIESQFTSSEKPKSALFMPLTQPSESQAENNGSTATSLLLTEPRKQLGGFLFSSQTTSRPSAPSASSIADLFKSSQKETVPQQTETSVSHLSITTNTPKRNTQTELSSDVESLQNTLNSSEISCQISPKATSSQKRSREVLEWADEETDEQLTSGEMKRPRHSVTPVSTPHVVGFSNRTVKLQSPMSLAEQPRSPLSQEPVITPSFSAPPVAVLQRESMLSTPSFSSGTSQVPASSQLGDSRIETSSGHVFPSLDNSTDTPGDMSQSASGLPTQVPERGYVEPSTAPSSVDTLRTNSLSMSGQTQAMRFSFGPSSVSAEPSEAFVGQTPNTRFPLFTTPTFGSGGATAVEKSGRPELGAVNVTQSFRTVDIRAPTVTTTETTASSSPEKNVEDEVKNIPQGNRAEYATGAVFTWGSGECDQLALKGSILNEVGAAPTPAIVMKLRQQQVISIACGALHTAALLGDGTVVTWGCNDDFCLGREGIEKFPGRVVGLPEADKVTALSCGDNHTAALTQSGICYIWGTYKDNDGYLGFPDFLSGAKTIGKTLIPTRVPINGRCLRVVSGENHTMVLVYPKSTTTTVNSLYPLIYAWGSNEFGQLCKEIPSPDVAGKKLKESYLFPQLLTSTELGFSGPIINIFCGCATTFFEIAIPEDENWTFFERCYYGSGRNSCGELGIGKVSETINEPEEIRNFRGKEMIDISSCQFASIGLASNGSVFTWGKKDYLGHGEGVFSENQSLPQRLAKIGDVRKIGTGGDTMFAIKNNGVLLSWGEGQMFQIGNGNEYLNPVAEPVVVSPSDLNNSSVLAACGGSQHSVALVFNGNYRTRTKCYDEISGDEAVESFFEEPLPNNFDFGKFLCGIIRKRFQKVLEEKKLREEDQEANVPSRVKRPRTEEEELQLPPTKRGKLEIVIDQLETGQSSEPDEFRVLINTQDLEVEEIEKADNSIETKKTKERVSRAKSKAKPKGAQAPRKRVAEKEVIEITTEDFEKISEPKEVSKRRTRSQPSAPAEPSKRITRSRDKVVLLQEKKNEIQKGRGVEMKEKLDESEKSKSRPKRKIQSKTEKEDDGYKSNTDRAVAPLPKKRTTRGESKATARSTERRPRSRADSVASVTDKSRVVGRRGTPTQKASLDEPTRKTTRKKEREKEAGHSDVSIEIAPVSSKRKARGAAAVQTTASNKSKEEETVPKQTKKATGRSLSKATTVEL